MLIISETARRDLLEIWSYAAEHNVDSAHKVIKELAKKFELLEANPKLGRTQDDLVVGIRLFPHKKYHIYYFPAENGVEIYRVLHGRRNIEELFEEHFEGLNE
jgi:toxin ParE1/3/4